MGNEPTTLEFSAATPRDAAFEEWEAAMQQNCLPLAVTPRQGAPFAGRLTSSSLDGTTDFGLTVIGATNQEVRRRDRHVRAAVDEYLFFSIQTKGQARLDQDGRSVLLNPGDTSFYDTSRPSCWTVDGACEMVAVQVPLRLVRAQPGVGQLVIPTAIALPPTSAAGVVSTYFRDLVRIREESPAQADILSRNALDLVSSAVLLATGEHPVDAPADTFGREQVLVYLRKHCTDPELTIDQVAAACHISRRTLFRAFVGTDDSFGTALRRLRLHHARKLLARNRTQSLPAVAFDSGFTSERHFYRVFQQEFGMTPGEYRRSHIG
ncbi:helix-turn-helix domain-containing protein [Nocardia sp. NPDC058666]|uniref:helix-turn-helix domain-containing protein n=1 Tax=unclassified Nocardia TaxID=2637762 RepID=UPI0036524532